MKARYAVVLLGLGMLLSCRTTEPVWFIATPGYVESRLAAQEEALRNDYERRIADLEEELESQRAVSEELAGLADTIKDVEQSNRELQDLAGQVEREIEGLPEETIRLIVDVLSGHLDPDER